MLLMYDFVLLKMSTWHSKHVEESNNIWRINNIQCITLVVLYGQFMMHGQRNIKMCCSLLSCTLWRQLCVPSPSPVQWTWLIVVYHSSFISQSLLPHSLVRPYLSVLLTKLIDAVLREHNWFSPDSPDGVVTDVMHLLLIIQLKLNSIR